MSDTLTSDLSLYLPWGKVVCQRNQLGLLSPSSIGPRERNYLQTFLNQCSTLQRETFTEEEDSQARYLRGKLRRQLKQLLIPGHRIPRRSRKTTRRAEK